LQKIGSTSELPISVIESESEFLQQEILVRFITGKTGIALSYRQLEKIFALVRNSTNQWSYHLEGEWTINCEGGKLSLKEK
jgi:hypothetical protein